MENILIPSFRCPNPYSFTDSNNRIDVLIDLTGDTNSSSNSNPNLNERSNDAISTMLNSTRNSSKQYNRHHTANNAKNNSMRATNSSSWNNSSNGGNCDNLIDLFGGEIKVKRDVASLRTQQPQQMQQRLQQEDDMIPFDSDEDENEGSNDNIIKELIDENHNRAEMFRKNRTEVSTQGGYAPRVSSLLSSFFNESEFTAGTTTATTKKRAANKTATATAKSSGRNDDITHTMNEASAKRTKITIGNSTSGGASNCTVKSTDFGRIEMFCTSLGHTNELNALKVKFAANKSMNASDRIAITLIWADEFLSNNHSNTSSKYCTPSTKCQRWNCTCDRTIRVQQGYLPLLGSIFTFASNPDTPYFLPLSLSQTEPRAAANSDYVLPLICSNTLAERIAFFNDIMNSTILKIVYNTQLFVLPLCTSRLSDKDSLTNKTDRIYSNVFDPKVAAFLCNSDLSNEQLELQVLLDVHTDCRSDTSTNDSTGVSRKATNNVEQMFHKVHCEQNAMFSLHYRLHTLLLDTKCMKVFSTVEMPLAQLLAIIELRGIIVNTKRLNELEKKVLSKLNHIQTSSSQWVDSASFNMASSDQCADVIYNKLKLPQPTKADGQRHASTSEDVLQKLKDMHPIVSKILAFRSASKLKGTYIDGYRGFITSMNSSGIPSTSLNAASGGMSSFFLPVSATATTATATTATAAVPAAVAAQSDEHRVHACWNQVNVRTGRLSCCRPNLQQIPNDQVIEGDTFNVRSIFQSSPNTIFIAADYSQIEMRVLAHFCSDPSMIRLFQGDSGDIYKEVASKIFKKTIDGINKDERDQAKVTALGVLYGMSVYGVGKQLNIDNHRAKKISNDFFANFPRINDFIHAAKRGARSQGYVTTLMGRRRYLPDITSNDMTKRSTAERQAVNSIIQGSASDIIKHSMLYVEAEIKRVYCHSNNNLQYKPRLVLTIHDELFYEVPGPGDSLNTTQEWLAYAKGFIDLLRNCMSKRVAEGSGLTKGLDLPVKISYGFDWGSMQELSLDTYNRYAASSSSTSTSTSSSGSGTGIFTNILGSASGGYSSSSGNSSNFYDTSMPHGNFIDIADSDEDSFEIIEQQQQSSNSVNNTHNPATVRRFYEAD